MENTTPHLVFLHQNFLEKTKIFSGNTELIDSKSVILFDINEPIEIEETFDSQLKILIKLFFQKNDSGKQTVEFNIDAPNNIIEYRCFNFDNTLGTCTQKPIEIGTIDDKKFFFHFWVHTLGKDDTITRKIEYSIWKEK